MTSWRPFLCGFIRTDDLADKDKPVRPEEIVWFGLKLFNEFAKNPFYQKNQAFIWPLLVTSGLAWIASEDFRAEPAVLDRLTGHVLKSQYADIFWGVAFLIGGFEHALAMSRRYRSYGFRGLI